jgi:uncharacterized membrane protein YjjP (DUF1212 family)
LGTLHLFSCWSPGRDLPYIRNAPPSFRKAFSLRPWRCGFSYRALALFALSSVSRGTSFFSLLLTLTYILTRYFVLSGPFFVRSCLAYAFITLYLYLINYSPINSYFMIIKITFNTGIYHIICSSVNQIANGEWRAISPEQCQGILSFLIQQHSESLNT